MKIEELYEKFLELKKIYDYLENHKCIFYDEFYELQRSSGLKILDEIKVFINTSLDYIEYELKQSKLFEDNVSMRSEVEKMKTDKEFLLDLQKKIERFINF